jgi:hypothetical protein
MLVAVMQNAPRVSHHKLDESLSNQAAAVSGTSGLNDTSASTASQKKQITHASAKVSSSSVDVDKAVGSPGSPIDERCAPRTWMRYLAAVAVSAHH